MKKSFAVNIGNKIFNIDEDAYALLESYLKQLRLTFTGDEGEEIVSDIEGRINEIFSMKAVDGDTSTIIITIDDVHNVIERVGSPEELGNGAKADGESQTTPPQSDDDDDDTLFSIKIPKNGGKKLYRSRTDSVLGGVVGGLATFMNWNSWILRLLLIFLCFATYVAPFFILYLILWMIIPEAATSRQRLEQMGAPVTVENVGETVRAEAVESENNLGCLERFISIIAKCVVAFVAIIAGSVALSLIVSFIVSCFGVIGLCVMPQQWMIDTFHISYIDSSSPMLSTLFILAAIVASLIPILALTWATIALLTKSRRPSTWVWVVAIAIEVIAISAALILGFALNY